MEIPVNQWLKVLLRKPPNVIITFNQKLDTLLGGGISLGHLTEVFGEKGVGKTSLCLQLCITIRLPRRIQGLESEAIFIDTEHILATSRLQEMAEGCAEHCRLIRGFESNITAESLLAGIHCLPCRSLEELEILVLDLDDYISRHPKVKLIAIDSLAFLFHTDVVAISSNAWMDRNRFLYRLVQELNQLINKYALAVVVTNNMTTRFGNNGEKYLSACLGPSWLYLPQVRLELQRDSSKRRAVLHKSSHCLPPENSALFTITSAGIR